MKIAIVCYPTFGGSGVIATELGLALSKEKHEIHFITYKQPVRLEQLSSNIYYHEVNVPEYPLFHYQPYELALSSKLVDTIKMHKIDLPDNLVQQELALISQSMKKEDLEKNKKENEKIAKKRVKLGLILNEIGEKNKIKVDEQELRNEIQKQVQSMPGQQKQVLEYYQKNPSAATSLSGSIYEEKILNLIKKKSKQTKKIITSDEAEKILKLEHDKSHIHNHEHSSKSNDEIEFKKPKKMVKSAQEKKKIRKK